MNGFLTIRNCVKAFITGFSRFLNLFVLAPCIAFGGKKLHKTAKKKKWPNIAAVQLIQHLLNFTPFFKYPTPILVSYKMLK